MIAGSHTSRRCRAMPFAMDAAKKETERETAKGKRVGVESIVVVRVFKPKRKRMCNMKAGPEK